MGLKTDTIVFYSNMAIIFSGESFPLFNLLPFTILLFIIMCDGMFGCENLSALLMRLYISWRN